MYLNFHSWFSFNFGTCKPAQLVDLAKKAGITEMALTDVNNTAGVFEFVRCCQAEGIRPLVGVEVRNGFSFCYLGLVHNEDGFESLNRWLSGHLMNKTNFPPEAPGLNHVTWMYSLETLPQRAPRPHERVGVKPSQLVHWDFLQNKDAFEAWQPQAVVWAPVTFADTVDAELHRLLRCIDDNILLSKQLPTAYESVDHFFIPPQTLAACYVAHPEILAQTASLIAQCRFEPDTTSYKNRRVFSDSGAPADDLLLITELAYGGMVRRYRNQKGRTEAASRIEKELKVIEQKEFISYFLIAWDIIRFAKSKGYFHVGRGSGANSMVAYCLGITDVDPIKLDLYFERFINPERMSLPDLDIDFSWDERGEIQAYIFQKYGPEHVAMLGSYVTYQTNSIVREMGKVLGIPDHMMDHITENQELYADTKLLQWYRKFAPRMEDMPRHGSVHAGGILISEASMYRHTALHLPPKGFATTQFDMYVAEDIQFAKLDILSQRGLGHIKEAADIIYENRGETVDVHDVNRFLEDDLIKNQIRSSETIGCFYIESPAMRQLLSKLRCDNYLTLVAASSIIRPGVAQSGMMKAYIERYNAKVPFDDYIHPVMKELLAETYGIMVYQEDVIKVAHHFAGFSPAQADVLRRSMSWKFRTRPEFIEIEKAYFSNCRSKGYSEYVLGEVWRQIESFAGFSFSKAHSATYAVESYQSLFLKTYYPKEFMVAVINNFGGFYRTEFYVHEARRSGAHIEPPCINRSLVKTTIRKDTIFLGFQHLKGLETQLAHRLVAERNANGRFRSLADVRRRVPMGLEQIVLLVRIGAFRFMGINKKELLWEAHALWNRAQLPRYTKVLDIFENEPADALHLPPLMPEHPIENAYDELELLGFALCSPFEMVDWRGEETENQKQLPLEIAEVPATHNGQWKPAQQALAWGPAENAGLAPGHCKQLKNRLTVKDLKQRMGQIVTMYGYLVTTKPLRTSKGQPMTFGCFLDMEGRFLDTVHFPKSLAQWPFKGRSVYRLTGKVHEEFGAMNLDVYQMVKMPRQVNPKAAPGYPQ